MKAPKLFTLQTRRLMLSAAIGALMVSSASVYAAEERAKDMPPPVPESASAAKMELAEKEAMKEAAGQAKMSAEAMEDAANEVIEAAEDVAESAETPELEELAEDVIEEATEAKDAADALAEEAINESEDGIVVRMSDEEMLDPEQDSIEIVPESEDIKSAEDMAKDATAETFDSLNNGEDGDMIVEITDEEQVDIEIPEDDTLDDQLQPAEPEEDGGAAESDEPAKPATNKRWWGRPY